MKFSESGISGVWILEPELHRDDRGFFGRTFCKREFSEHGIEFDCVQCNLSHNARKGILRGMHFQVAPHEEPKVVSCPAGAVFDVAIDLRKSSPTFGKWTGIELSAENRKMLFIPKGCAHGFVTLQNDTDVLYLMGEYYHPESSRGARFDDPRFGIAWPLKPAMVSEKDRSYPQFEL